MRITPVCEQKGLRTYLVVRASKDCHVRYRATVTTNGTSIDVPVIRPEGGYYAVAVLPALGTEASTRVELKERHTGKTADIVELSRAELIAKISRRVPEKLSLLGLIDQVDSQNPLHRGQYDMNLDDYFDTFDGDVVWRIAIDWRGSLKSMPRLELVDGNLKKVNANIHEFEFQEGLRREGCTVNRLIATFRIPRSLMDFCLFAHDPQKEVVSNFYPMDSVAAASLIDERSTRMQCIDGQQELYQIWLKGHLTKLQAAESDCKSTRECDLHVIVFDKKGVDRTLDQTLDSLKQQHCDGWHATVLRYGTASLKDTDGRIEAIDASRDTSIPNALKKISGETTASHICMVNAGDIFARGAFAAIASAPLAPDGVILFDEDAIDAEGIHFHPQLKGTLNKQLEYTENWTGYGALFPTSLFRDDPLDDLESPSLVAYALALSAMEKNLPFESIPYVLLHVAIDGSVEDGRQRQGFLPDEVDSAKNLLSHHLDAIGASAKVQDGLMDGTLKITLDNASPGRVSVIIPTADHTDMLDRCVSSILSTATYHDIEIILVENNSKETKTFALYERLQRENPGILKVVNWNGPFNYSAIINFGVAASTGDFLLLLNNDTEVIVPSFIEEMLALATIPEVGVVGAKLYFKDMLVQHAGMLIGPYRGISHVNQNFSDIRPGYQNRALTTCSFSSVTGACQMVRREVFDEVGGYDEAFVVGFNDADFCLKVRAAGYDVVFTPYAELYHYEFVSRGREVIDDDKQARWRSERDSFFAKWDQDLRDGDPLTNPNFDKDNWYYALPSQ